MDFNSSFFYMDFSWEIVAPSWALLMGAYGDWPMSSSADYVGDNLLLLILMGNAEYD